MTEEEFKKNAKTIPTNIETEEKIALDYFKYKVLPTTNGAAFESKEEHYTKMVLNVIKKLQNENERQQDIIIEKDRQLHLMYKVLENKRGEIEDIKGLLDNYIPKDKIRKKLKAREEDREDCDNSIIANNLLRDIYLLRELLEEE